MRHIFSILLALLLLTPLGGYAATDAYQMGVFPNLPTSKLYELFPPLAEICSKAVGKKVLVGTRPTFEAFVSLLDAEFYDIAHVQPFDYVDAHDKHNYLPLARRDEDIEALFVVRANSRITSISELRGKKIASPPPDAAVSHLATMSLKSSGLNPQKDVVRQYLRNHFSCLHNVLIGESDACVASVQMIRQFENEKKMTSPFKVVHRSTKIPHTLFVVHKRVPKRDRDLLLQAIISLPQTEQGRKILSDLNYKPFIPARDSDYDLIRSYIRSGK